ncbi:hypothetical protein N658DRAFT_506284 [Parathielavia hyrcaniae]|uniref:Uncharacterized protein n=1 Tax=Parathielavia hyrcaniae TaxID=113614 RepID=A0AAN6Q326_9PEZI|nr:hypothetical protein N658DRAFT_506284 [Parathielavia hyrcaniae]
MRKRLKNPAPLEISERKQVGDAEAALNPLPSTAAANQRTSPPYLHRGSDSAF